MAQTINFLGTGGIIEGNLGTSNVNVNLDSNFKSVDSTNNQQILGASIANLGNQTNYTVMAWIKQSAGQSDSGGTVVLNGDNFDLDVNDTGYIRFAVRPGGSYIDVSTAGSYGTAWTKATDGWHHICGRWDSGTGGGTLKIFIDGQEVATRASVGTSATTAGTQALKMFTKDTNHDDQFAGEIVDVKCFNSVVSDDDIKILASKINTDIALTSSASNCQVWYKLNDVTETTPQDSSGNTNHGPTGGISTKGSALTKVYDSFSVDVYDNSTTTDGTFTVTQGKVEGKALTSLTYDGSSDNVDTEITFQSEIRTGFSMSAWIKPDDGITGSNQALIGAFTDSNHSFVLYIDSGAGKLSARIVTDGVTKYAVEDSASFVDGANPWKHVVFTTTYVDSSNATMKLYVDGVERTLNSSNNGALSGNLGNYNGSDIRIGINPHAGGFQWDFAGKIRGVRFNDNVLTADQIASLYSNTYPVTPDYWWKMDDNLLAPAGAAYVESFGTKTDPDAVRNGATYNNGTLDLDGAHSLTIAANGTLSAPRGSLLVAGDFQYADGANFTHNNGEVEFNGADPDLEMEGAHSGRKTPTNPLTFHKLKVSTVTNYLNVYVDFTVENTWTITNDAIYGIAIRQPAFITIGTSSSSGTITGPTSGQGNIYFAGSATGSKVLAPSSINPWIYTGNDWGWSASNGNTILLENGDYQTALVTDEGYYNQSTSGNNITIQLTGDMEFDAVTVSDGDTLDFNGQRMECSGLLTYTGSVTDGGDKSLVLASSIDTTGTARNISGASDLILTGSGNVYWGTTGGGWNATLFNGGTFDTWAGSDTFGTTIVGAGTLDINSATSFGNLTTATGGTLQGNAQTLTVAGDFTTSGGLLGASCLRFDGSNDTVTIPISDSENDHIKGAFADGIFTVEGWIKMESDFAGGNWVQKNQEFAVDIARDSATQWALADGGSWNFSANPFTMPNLEDGKWHHLAFCRRYTGSQAYYDIYVDGKLETVHTMPADSATWTANDDDLFIGSYNGTTSFLGGGADDTFVENVRIWGTTRTEAQIRADMFNSTPTSSASDCIANFTFNEGTGTAITASDPNNASSNETAGTWNGSWAEAGTLTWTGGSTPSEGTLVMNSSSAKSLNIPENQKFFNMTVSGSGTLTVSDTPYIYGLLDSSGANIVRSGNFGISGTTTPTVSGTTFANISTMVYQAGSGNTTTATATTYATLRPSNSTPVLLGGATTATTVQLDGGTSLTTQGHNLTTKTVSNSGTLNIDKASSLTFTDVSGCGFGSSSGTLNCKGSAGASFDGLENEMTADSNPLPGSGPFTYTCWFRTSATGIQNGLADFTANSARGMFMFHNNNKPFIYLGSNNYRYWDAAPSFLDGNWHHMSLYIPGYAQADITNITLHIDGTLQNVNTTLSSGAAEQPTMAQLKIGGGYSSNNNWDGDIADVRIFEKALTDANRTTLRSVNPSKVTATSYPDSDNDIGATHWWKLNESNFPSDDAADSVGSIACSVTGAVPNRITITSAGGSGVSNRYDVNTNMTQTMSYTTMSYGANWACGSGTADVTNCTFDNMSGYAANISSGSTITAFNHNTISNTTHGLSCGKAHAAFDNIVITGISSTDMRSQDNKLEFTNSNFDITNLDLGSSGSIISKDHNDTSDLYEMAIGSTLSFSSITNEFSTDADVKLREGILTMDEDNKVCDTFNVYSGATVKVSDGNDWYVQGAFDNDGTWDQTAGFGGEIHVGDFTPFDSGDIIDDTDFVDTGFHDITHYLEMDL